MFGSLRYYGESGYWQEHPSVYLVLDGGIYRYDIFAACGADLKRMVYRLDIEDRQLEREFIQYCLERSVIDTGIAPDAGARILILSTCTENGRANRWVVQGYLAQVHI